MVLTAEEQENIRRAIEEKIPEDFGITGKLWTLGRTRQYIQKQFHKAINDLTDEQWKRVEPMLPPERTGKKGRPRNDNRKMLNGMLWMNHSGAQWRQLPQCYGPWQSVYARFAKWRDDGLWEKIFTVLSQDADTENLSIDSTCVKVHESSNGGEKNGK